MHMYASNVCVFDSSVCVVQYASASLNGEGVFGCMKHESGVHRVQRVPQTEASGRIHTSTMSVVILPQPSQVSQTPPTGVVGRVWFHYSHEFCTGRGDNQCSRCQGRNAKSLWVCKNSLI